MARIFFLILLSILFSACTFRGSVTPPDMDKVQFASPSPEEGAMPGVPITNESMLKDALEQALGSDQLEVTITADENSFAAGTVKKVDTNQELQWYAVKEKGGWQIIATGQDIIRCSDLADYPDFSKTLLPQCLSDQNTPITR